MILDVNLWVLQVSAHTYICTHSYTTQTYTNKHTGRERKRQGNRKTEGQIQDEREGKKRGKGGREGERDYKNIKVKEQNFRTGRMVSCRPSPIS